MQAEDPNLDRRPSPPRPPALRALAAALAAALAVLLACGGSDPPPDPSDPGEGPVAVTPLDPERPVERSLAGGDVHFYRLELPAAHLLAIEADSSDVDLAVSLSDPGGEPLAGLESPGSRWGVERLLALTADAGAYWLEVRGEPAGEAGGGYELSVAELRPATELDALRLEAQKLHAQALALSENNRAETNEQALLKFRQALELWQRARDRAGEAESRHWIALMQKDLSRFQESEESFLAALEIRRQLEPGGAAEAETLYRLGTLYRLWGRYDDALGIFERGLALWRRLGERHRQASTLYNQAMVYRRLAAMQQSLDHYARVRAIYRDLGQRRMEARTLSNVAAIHQMLGESDRALEDLAGVLAIHRELDDPAAQAATLNNLGWVHHQARGEPGKAVEYFEQALRLAAAEEDLRAQATYLDNLGRARLDLGDPRTALLCAEQGYDLSLHTRNPDGQARGLLAAGLAHLALGETAAATDRFAAALELSRSIGSRTREAEALYRLAQARRQAGRLDGARESIAQSLTLLESVRTDVDSRSLKSAFLAFRRPYYELEIELLVELAQSRPGEGWEGLALGAAERARARGLLETLAAAGTDLRAGVDPALLAEEQELRRRINEAELHRRSAGDDEQEAISKRLRNLLDDLEKVAARIREESPQYADLARPRPLGLDEIQDRVLDDDSLLLEVSLGEERSFLFAVTASSIEVFDLPPRAEIDAAAEAVYALLTDRFAWQGPDWREHRERYRRAAAELAGKVLGPAATRLDGQRLLIAAEGALHYIPFAALPIPGTADATGGGDFTPLVAAHEIVHLPSASSVAVLRRQLSGRPPAPRILALLADPVFDPGDPRLTAGGAGSEPIGGGEAAGRSEFRRLPHSRREAEGIAALVAPADRYLATAFAASRETAMGPELGRYRFLHFATHGLLNGHSPELSGLVLSLVDEAGRPRDGFLRLHDIYNLELNAELVVLSACQTGLGKAIRGEGLVGLVRGFFHAGSRRVIASLWRIEDEATAVLMERLYRGLLQQGLPPAAALRQAQLELRGGGADPAWQAPYFWAAFVLQGEWRPLAGGMIAAPASPE